MTSARAIAAVERLGFDTNDHNPRVSDGRFPDGAAWRVEIPSVEGPACLEAVLSEAERLEVPVVRVSQGTGVTLLRDTEIDAMVQMAAEADVELSLFARPCAGWGPSAMAASQAGAILKPTSRGGGELAAVVDEMLRAADHGVRSVLIADLGALQVFGQLRAAGELPSTMQAKVSVMLAAANPAAAKVLVELGADTLNLPTDLSVGQIASIRAAVDVPIDFYVEAPDNIGGFVRHHELPQLVDVAAPVYIKFGLRNAPDVYPAGTHLESTTVALSRERVRRARLGLDLLERAEHPASGSGPGAEGLAIPDGR